MDDMYEGLKTMPHKITSTIEIEGGGCNMGKHKRHHRQRAKSDADATISEKVDDNGQKYTSTATSHRNRLFHQVKNANAGVTQNVRVEVKVEKEDDCLTSCFAGLAKCFGRGG